MLFGSYYYFRYNLHPAYVSLIEVLITKAKQGDGNSPNRTADAHSDGATFSTVREHFETAQAGRIRLPPPLLASANYHGANGHYHRIAPHRFTAYP